MNELNWELSVLSQAINYKNLSAAASNIGVSQPQLSRILATLESELDIALLNRNSKRQSGWTPQAQEVTTAYLTTVVDFKQKIAALGHRSGPSLLRIGSLEGLVNIALTCADRLLKNEQINTLYADVEDLTELESKFLDGHYDIILTMREPGRNKWTYAKEIGFQLTQQIENKNSIHCFSHYEANQLFGHKSKNITAKSKSKGLEKKLISNSLLLRSHWIRDHKGSGLLPSSLKKGKAPQKSTTVFAIAKNTFPEGLWKTLW